MSKSLRAVASLMVLAFLTSPAAAYHIAWRQEPMGGPGDIQNTIVCPEGQYIKGLRGRTGAWVDRLTIICTQLQPGGVVGGSKSAESVGGGGGQDQGPTLCPSSIVYEIDPFMTQDARMVQAVEMRCLDPATRQGVAAVIFGPIGNDTFSYWSRCPDGMAAVGVTAHWGTHVNGVALACNPLVIP